jgi:hypothetical protein
LSKKRNRNKQHPDKAAEHHQPTHQNQASPVRPNPSAVNTATNENQWRIRQERLLERQVNTAKWTNIITASAAAAGLVGLVILWGTLDAAKTQATAAKIQAETARRELEISHRPWIASVRPAEIAEPFVFHDIGGVTFTLRVPIKNTGSSTAINVVGWPVPVFDKSVNMNARLATWRTGFNCNSKKYAGKHCEFCRRDTDSAWR